MQRLSMGNRFNTAAGIACQFSTEQKTKPLISRKTQKTVVVWTEENWPKAQCSDESKFHLFGSFGKHCVRCQTEERLKPKGVKKLVKGGGGCVMVWWMFSAGARPLI